MRKPAALNWGRFLLSKKKTGVVFPNNAAGGRAQLMEYFNYLGERFYI
jgi:hypothetical protein